MPIANCQVLSTAGATIQSMFTGIIEEVGSVTGIALKNGNRRLTVAPAD